MFILKKISYIFITIITLLLSIGSYGLFSLFINQYHVSIKKDIDNYKSSITDTIYINPSELYANSKTVQWEDDNHEIIYFDKLYDIVSINNENGKVKILAISDKREMEYRICFAQQEDISKTTNSPMKLLKQFLNLKFVCNNPIDFSNPNNPTVLNQNLAFQLTLLNTQKGFYTIEYTPPIYSLI